MAGHSQSADDEIGGTNVRPFVDIALVLLIIFMVTAKYIVSQQIPVDLPQAASSQSAAEVRLAAISIDLVRLAGITKFAIQTEPPSEAPR